MSVSPGDHPATSLAIRGLLDCLSLPGGRAQQWKSFLHTARCAGHCRRCPVLCRHRPAFCSFALVCCALSEFQVL